jgi:hypothetical protein
VNSASRERGGFTRGREGRGSQGSFNNGGRGRGDSSNKARNRFPPCQLCGRTNHLVFKCYKRFDPTYMGEDKTANTARSYGVDSNWYADSGATDHVTGNLEKLTVRDTYNGHDQIYAANGTGMHIKNIGHSIIHTPYQDLSLSHVLHVLQATKSIASVHHIASDNNVFFELHSNFFFIKDRESRKILLQGRTKGGLYPLPCSTTPVHAGQALSTVKISASRWHTHLGHPSSSIVKVVLSKNSLPVISDTSSESVCDSCQQGKSHQLPYPVSTSILKGPLELIFFNVWGPACDSIRRYKYYVTFIDDYSKFTWLFLLKHKSEVF